MSNRIDNGITRLSYSDVDGSWTQTDLWERTWDLFSPFSFFVSAKTRAIYYLQQNVMGQESRIVLVRWTPANNQHLNIFTSSRVNLKQTRQDFLVMSPDDKFAYITTQGDGDLYVVIKVDLTGFTETVLENEQFLWRSTNMVSQFRPIFTELTEDGMFLYSSSYEQILRTRVSFDNACRVHGAVPGFYCPAGSSSAGGSQCPWGYFCAGQTADKQPCTSLGHYCPPGASQELPCAAGTFSNQSGQSVCQECPAHATTSLGATNRSDCACMPGFTGENGGPARAVHWGSTKRKLGVQSVPIVGQGRILLWKRRQLVTHAALVSRTRFLLPGAYFRLPVSATRDTQVRTEGLAQVAGQERSRGCLVVSRVRIVLRIHRLQLRATRQVIVCAIWVITGCMEGLARLVWQESTRALLLQPPRPRARPVRKESTRALLLQPPRPRARLVWQESTQPLLLQPQTARARLVWQESTRPILLQPQRPRARPVWQESTRVLLLQPQRARARLVWQESTQPLLLQPQTARARLVWQESTRPILLQLQRPRAVPVPLANRRLRGRMLAATAMIVPRPSILVCWVVRGFASTALTARPRLLARMPAVIVRTVLRASTALGLDRSAPTALLGRRLGPLVRHKQVHV